MFHIYSQMAMRTFFTMRCFVKFIRLEESFLRDTYLVMTLLAIEFFERNQCNPIKIRPGDHTDEFFFQ